VFRSIFPVRVTTPTRRPFFYGTSYIYSRIVPAPTTMVSAADLRAISTSRSDVFDSRVDLPSTSV
ncbi:MAG: hypothetical protein ACKOGL_00910, partial [Acidimicrobiaceae bacterium]